MNNIENKKTLRLRFLPHILGILLTFYTFNTAATVAQNKLFWNDEGHDIMSLLHENMRNLIFGDNPQPNNNPIYYVFQKIAIDQTSHIDEQVLVKFRIVSIVGASLTVLFLYFFVLKRLGCYWAVFTVLVLINQPIFFLYAAETRHYMTWILFFTLLVLSTVVVIAKPYDKLSLKEKAYFIGSCIGLSLVVTMGMIQVGLAVFMCLLVWFFYYPTPKASSPWKPLYHFGLPVVILCFGIELYYGLKNPSVYGVFGGSPWDLMLQIKNGDYSLIKMPPRLLIPKPGRDTHLGGHFENIALLIGLMIPFLIWKRKQHIKKDMHLANAISMAAIPQVLSTVIIAGIVIYCNFYFVQRVFIYLIVCHPLLTLAGTVFILHEVPISSFKKNIIKGVILLSMIGLTIQWQHEKFYEPRPVEQCEIVKARSGEGFQIIGKQTKTMSPVNAGFAKLNTVVRINQNLKQCGWHIDSQKPLFLWYSNDDKWFLTEQVPFDGQPFVLHEPIAFFNDRGSR